MTGPATSRRVAAVALIAAVVLLAVTFAWAVADGDDDDGWGLSRMGSGMMGYAPLDGDGSPVRSIEAARDQAERFADRLDLRVGEVMQFDNHFYAELADADGDLATEVLVDPRGGAVAIEPGPAMMWNTRYGMMGGRGGMMGGAGMMGGSGGSPYGGMMGADPTWPGERDRRDVSESEARTLGDRWLRAAGSELRVSEPESFPGYYTLHTTRDGRVTGMLSVSASTGAVWPHWWHGRFVRMSS
jgi:hypothetical protein